VKNRGGRGVGVHLRRQLNITSKNDGVKSVGAMAPKVQGELFIGLSDRNVLVVGIIIAAANGVQMIARLIVEYDELVGPIRLWRSSSPHWGHFMAWVQIAGGAKSSREQASSAGKESLVEDADDGKQKIDGARRMKRPPRQSGSTAAAGYRKHSGDVHGRFENGACQTGEILSQIVRPQLRATGYGIMNFVSISCGGLADWGFGVLRDRKVPLNVIFGIFAGAAIASVILVLLTRSSDNTLTGAVVMVC